MLFKNLVRKHIIWFLLAVIYFLVFQTARGVSPVVYFEKAEGEILIGSEFEVKLLINTLEALNAYSVEFKYPEENLRVLGLDDSRSIIDIWQTRPTVSGNTIHFSGGSLSSLANRNGELISIRFAATKEATVELRFSGISVYLADGQGTKVIPETNILNFTILPGQAPKAALGILDTIPPEIKLVSFVPDPFDETRKLLGFTVYDRASGVKEILSRARSNIFWGPWQETKNPTAFPQNVWSIELKATDNQGNVTRITVYDWREFWKSPLAIFLVAIIALFLAVNIVRRARRKKKL